MGAMSAVSVVAEAAQRRRVSDDAFDWLEAPRSGAQGQAKAPAATHLSALKRALKPAILDSSAAERPFVWQTDKRLMSMLQRHSICVFHTRCLPVFLPQTQRSPRRALLIAIVGTQQRIAAP